MKYKKTIKSYHQLSFILALGLNISLANTSMAKAHDNIAYALPLDSIGSEIINGNRFVIHKLEPKENYFQLSRRYSVSVADIKAANNNKNLIIGDKIKIPRGKATVATAVASVQSAPKREENVRAIVPQEATEYKVGKSETLYSISRRFRITVEDIKKFNNLSTDILREGMVLKIPQESIPVEEPVQLAQVQQYREMELPTIIEESQPIDDSMFKANKYGIREKKERGVGLWMDSLKGDGQTSLALHKTAPIGTILKITNPMNQSVTFAKVVGKFGDNDDTQGAIVVFSKSVATSIGILDKKFQVEITYGVPLD